MLYNNCIYFSTTFKSQLYTKNNIVSPTIKIEQKYKDESYYTFSHPNNNKDKYKRIMGVE